MFNFSLLDMVPYSRSVFFELVGQYNLSIWPAQIPVLIFAVYLIYLSIKTDTYVSQVVLPAVGLAWIISGWYFFMQNYAGINWIGRYFGYLFIIQGVLLMVSGLAVKVTFFTPQTNYIKHLLAFLLILVFLLYPLTGLFDGRSFIQLEVFALTPDATLLVTLVYLSFIKGKIKFLLLPIPAVWSVISISFAFGLELFKLYWVAAVLIVCLLSFIYRRN